MFNSGVSMNKLERHGVKVLRKAYVEPTLDLIGAAEQHVLWKNKLGHHVTGRIKDELESGLIGQDGICKLGSWIKGAELHNLRNTQAYRELDFAHALFHEFGGNIMEKLQQGDRGGAEELYKNEYSLAMQHIIKALTKINQLLENPSTP